MEELVTRSSVGALTAVQTTVFIQIQFIDILPKDFFYDAYEDGQVRISSDRLESSGMLSIFVEVLVNFRVQFRISSVEGLGQLALVNSCVNTFYGTLFSEVGLTNGSGSR